MIRHRLPLRVQLPVPPPAPPAPPVPPPAAPVPPPAPEPLLLPALPLDEPVAPPSPALPPEGELGVLSGGMTGPLVAPDLVPAASAPSPAAKVAREAAPSNPARKSEVILVFFMVRLQKMSRYLKLV